MSLAHIATFTAAAAASINGWGGWSVSYYDLKLDKEVQIKVDIGQIRSDSNPRKYWLRETNSSLNTVRWTTSDLCPSVEKILSSMANLKIPKVYVPGIKNPTIKIIPPDSAKYSFIIPAVFSDETSSIMEIRGIKSKEFSYWYRYTSEKLQTCWNLDKPNFQPS